MLSILVLGFHFSTITICKEFLFFIFWISNRKIYIRKKESPKYIGNILGVKQSVTKIAYI